MIFRNILSFMAAVFLPGVLFAAEAGARIDINPGKDAPVPLKIGAVENGTVQHPPWVKDPDQKAATLFSDFPASGEWKQGSFSFTPEKDGKATLVLMGRWGKDAASREWVLFDGIEVEGAVLQNRGFEEGSAPWYGPEPQTSPVAKEGKRSARVNLDHPMGQKITLKAGQTVKLSFWFKSEGAPPVQAANQEDPKLSQLERVTGPSLTDFKPSPNEFRIFYIGDSITRHGYNAEIVKRLKWDHEAGMAASSEEKDYPHLVAAEIKEITGKKILLFFGPGGDAVHALESIPYAEKFLPNLVVVQLGEHVPSKAFGGKIDDSPEKIAADYAKLLDALRALPSHPMVICTGIWSPDRAQGKYDGRVAEIETIQRKVCRERNLPFVSVEKYAMDPTCSGTGLSGGVQWHPNDAGHAGYAREILDAFREHRESSPAADDLSYLKGALVWQDNFTSGNGWSRLKSARFANGILSIRAGEGSGDSEEKALTRNVLGQETKSTQETNYTVSRGVMDPLENAAGYLMEVSVEIKSSGVPVPDVTWKGVRFAVNYATSTTDFNDIYYGIRGNFGWETFRFQTRIPSDVRNISVTLGILGREGEASFRNLKFTVADLPRRAYFRKNPPPPYKGQNLGGLRGFNSQNGVIRQLKRIAPKWNANVYKLGRMKLPKEILPDAELDRWLEANIFKIWDLAPVKAAEAGVYFVMELSASQWRDPADKTGSTEFQYYKPEYADYLVKIWEKIARRYRGAKNIYGFELLNESPIRIEKQPGCPDYEEMMERIALVINKIDPDRTIIVQPEEYWGLRAFETMRPINARNVVYAPHFYSPFPFTHQMIGGNRYPVPYPGKVGTREWNKELLRRDLQPARDFQQAYNVHMIVSEFGAIAAAPGREQWVNDAIEIFEEYDWDWMFHAAEEWWGWRPDWVLNTELPFDPAKWSDKKFWKEDDSAPAGQVLRKYFQKNRLPAIAPSR